MNENQTEQHLTNTTFSSFELPEKVLQGIEDTGFSYCTPIQAESLGIVIEGKDIAGQAQTGTGKTAAFLLGTYSYLLKNSPSEHREKNQPRCIVLAPTRELAVQIFKDAEKLGKYTGFKHVAVYGGTGYESQRNSLEEGVDILIGTPGRIIDYFKQGVFNLKQIQVLVLDEADRMFDLGFIKDIRYLLRRMPSPEKRLNMLFSATLSHRVNELAYEHMNNPQQVVIESENITSDRIQESLYYPAMEEKIPLLLGLLNSHPDDRVVVFINTKRVAERIDDYFRGNEINGAVLSGDVPQKKRLRLLEEFKQGKLKVLVATDVAARGLHIDDVNRVINFDLPQDVEDYVHRIGRTGRAGASGEAISFACEEYVFSLPEIEEYIGHKIPVESIDPAILIEPKPPVRRPKSKRPAHNKSGNKNSRNYKNRHQSKSSKQKAG